MCTSTFWDVRIYMHVQLLIFIILTGIIPLVGDRSLNYIGVHSPFSVYQKHVNLQHKHVGMSGQLRMTSTRHKNG